MGTGALLFALLAGFVSAFPSSSLSLDRRDAGDLCHVREPQVALVDNKLYFMRGEYTFDDQDPGPEPAIYWIGLDTKFPVEEPIPSDRLNSVTIPEDVTPFGVNQSLVAGPLFYTNDSIYVVAGMGDAANNVLPVFDTTTEDWSAVTVEGGNFNTHNRLQSVVASDQRTGLSFMIGGDLGRFHFGMIRFDASDEASPQWTNETTNDVSGGIEVPSILEGSMVYLPMGEAGVLLAIGGYDSTRKGIQYGDNFDYDQILMNKLSVYDIHNSAWYTVDASGDIPGNRTNFCAAVSAAPDYSSFQVTVYGGWDLTSYRNNEEVYVLSVPSFRWIRVEQTDNFEAQDPDVGRSSHACVSYNDAQMIVLGGLNSNSESARENPGCGSQFPPLRVLDTSSYTWKTDFDPSRKYSVPKTVFDVIGGDASGNAVMHSPENGFNLSALTTLFSRTLLRAEDGRAESLPTNDDDRTSEEPKTRTRPAPGSIVGSVIGGLAVIALISIAVFFYLRQRRKSQHQPTQPPELSGVPAIHELPHGGDKKPTEMLAAVPVQELDGTDRRLDQSYG